MLEVDSVGISILIRQTAYLLQDGKMMADSINRIAFLFRGKRLIVVDELLCQLSKCQIFHLVLVLDELPDCQAHIVITGISPFALSMPIRALRSSQTTSVIRMSVICVSMLP